MSISWRKSGKIGDVLIYVKATGSDLQALEGVRPLKPLTPSKTAGTGACAPDPEDGSDQTRREELPQAEERFDLFTHIFNEERPHQALDIKYPSELYVSSSDPNTPSTIAPSRSRTAAERATQNQPQQIVSGTSASKEVSYKVWLVSFMQYDLGVFGHETGRINQRPEPIRRKSVTYVPGINVADVVGTDR
jgi:hypothetical protein